MAKDNDCLFCSKPHTKEWMQSMEFRVEHNLWDNIDDVIATLYDKKWTWSANTDCKYLDVRIDMRDGGCIIKDRSGKRMSPKQLRWQYSKDTPKKPSNAEAYSGEE